MKTIATTIAILLAGAALRAELSGSTPLATLVERADLILVGDITAARSVDRRSSSIEIARVLKGNPGGDFVAFRWSRIPGDATETRTVRAMLFLDREGPDDWVSIPLVTAPGVLAHHVFLLPSDEPPPGFPEAPNGDLLGKVAAELRHAVARDSDPLRLASDFQALLSLERSGDDAASLARTVRDRLLRGLPVPSSLSSLLCLAADPSAISPAVTILKSAKADEFARRCAASLLRVVHSKAALPALAAALDSPDPEIAYQGMMGLSAYAMDMPPGATRGQPRAPDLAVLSAHSPSIRLYEKDSTRYLEFWRRWWACEACGLDQPACDVAACRKDPP